ncbi:MAG: DUF5372 family protein [Rhodoplanes sp.]
MTPPSGARSRAPQCGPTRSLPIERQAAPASAASRRPRSAASKTRRLRAACNSARNADLTAATPQLVRITHPFHPFSGRSLMCIGERWNRFGKRLLLRVDDDVVCSVPPQWTDMVAPPLHVAMGQGRALFLVEDLLALAGLVTRLSGERPGASDPCNENDAASVRKKMPQKD